MGGCGTIPSEQAVEQQSSRTRVMEDLAARNGRDLSLMYQVSLHLAWLAWLRGHLPRPHGPFAPCLEMIVSGYHILLDTRSQMYSILGAETRGGGASQSVACML